MRRWCHILLLAVSVAVMAGCTAAVHFPFEPTSAPLPKPDPQAGRIDVQPAEATNPVRTQRVLLATKVMVPLDGEVHRGVGLLGSPCFEIPR